MRRGRPPYPGLLTPREQEVLDLLRQGLTNRQIAQRLHVSLATANYHVSEILSKLSVSSREEAAALPPSTFERRWLWLPAALATHLYAVPSSFAVKLVGAGIVGGAGLGLLLLAVGLLTMDGRRSGTAPLAEQSGLGRLAYVIDGDLWTQPVPNGTAARLTRDGLSFQPQWSPSGDWILYRHREGDGQNLIHAAWLMRDDGSSARRLTGAVAAWSPAADSVAYVSPDGSIVVENADGSQRRTIVAPASGESLSGPAWSPDGTNVAYTETSPDASSRDGTSVRLMIVEAAGGRPRELLAWQGGILRIEAWTGDGKNLLLTRSEVVSTSLQADGLSLWLAPVDGAPPTALALDALTYQDFISPRPGGPEVALIEGGGRNAWANKRLLLQNSRTGATSYVTAEGIAASSPSWSPDGAGMAYVAAPDAGKNVVGGDPARAALALRRIWIANPASGSPGQVTDDEAYRDEWPLWSTDGATLLFARLDREGHASVWTLSLTSGLAEMVVPQLSVGGALATPQPDLWFGYYGHIPWDQLFDWWQPPD